MSALLQANRNEKCYLVYSKFSFLQLSQLGREKLEVLARYTGILNLRK